MSPVPSRRHRSSVRDLQLLGAAVFAAAVAVLVWFTWTHGSAPPETAGAEYTPTRPSATTPAAKRPVAVFIGDSYTQGENRWPTFVARKQGWTEVNMGRGGTGYQARGSGPGAKKACGFDVCKSFPEMVDAAVKRHPDVVVVAGGRNDGGVEITEQVHETFTALREGLPKARIIAVQPMWDASDYPAFLIDYGKVIKKEVQAVDGEYLKIGSPLEGRPNLVQDDEVHPTDEGQKVLADAVNEGL